MSQQTDTVGSYTPHSDVAVAVIGAGISGLAAAWAVRQSGRRVIVLEAGDRVGGAIATADVDGYRIELGPSSMIERDDLTALIDEVGLAGARVGPTPSAARRYLVRHGRAIAVPNGPPAALGTPLLSLRGKLRALAEPMIPAAPDGAREESLAALVRRRFGAEPLDALIDPVVSGVYAGDPERLSSRHVLRTMHELEHEYGSVIGGAVRRAMQARRSGAPRRRRPAMLSFDGGLRRLPDAMADALGTAVRLRTRLVELRRDGVGWTLIAERDGRSEYHHVGAVVLAAPSHALSTIATEPTLDALLAPIARVAHAPIATVALGFRREDVAHPLDGFGVLVPSRERMDVLGALFASSVFGGRAPDGQVLLTCFLGGARRPELALEPVERVEQRALAALRPLLGVRGRPTLVHATRWTPGIPQYEIGYGAVLDAAIRTEARFPGLMLAGSWRGGVSLGDCISNGLAAGRRALDAIGGTRTAIDLPSPTIA